jgi:hypothetical protein
MAFPPEFKFGNEQEFIDRFLIPLLQRLGFSLVVNYHGNREFGKDLLFAELDRFGHVRYHALQAKYVPSISLNEVEELISDCKQAFMNPFTHPQTGAEERISSFYAVNGGSLGNEAVDHFFNSLRPQFGANVQLFQGRHLLMLDRWSSLSQVQFVGERLTGIKTELAYNLLMSDRIGNALNLKNTYPIERYRLDATSAYLCIPILPSFVGVDEANAYWHIAANCNRLLDYSSRAIISIEEKERVEKHILESMLPEVNRIGQKLLISLESAANHLGPIVTL